MNGVLLLVLGAVFFMLDLWASTADAALVALCWWVLLFQPRKG